MFLKYIKLSHCQKNPVSRHLPDFRPISVLTTVDKIFEKVIAEKLINYIYTNNVLCEHQFGFTKGSGTKNALVNVVV